MDFTAEQRAMIEQTIFLINDYNSEHDRVLPYTDEPRDILDGWKISFGFDEKGALLAQKQSAFIRYVAGLEYEQIQFIRTVMYIGRNGYENETTAEELYKSEFNGISWTNDNLIEAGEIFSKSMKLSEYLQKGIKLLSE